MIKLDCSYGEGGGQIIRTALALSTITGKPFSAYNIRQGRKEPGLKSQHLHCIEALKKLCGAKAAYAHLGSEKLEYVPGEIKGGTMDIDIGTAGSISLLLQAVLLPCFMAKKKTKLKIKGGTSGKWATPFDFFKEVILPQLRRFGDIEAKIIQRGYYPHGGGKVEVTITPKEEKSPIEIVDQGNIVKIRGISHASVDLQNADVAERQARSAKILLAKYGCNVNIQTEYTSTLSTGSGITIWAHFSKDDDMDMTQPIIIGADALGEKGKKSELVGREAAEKLIKEIDSKAPLDVHTADTLIPYAAVFNGILRFSELTDHIKTNAWTCQQFLDKDFSFADNIITCKDK